MDWVLLKDDESYLAVPTQVVEDSDTPGRILTRDRVRILKALAEEPMYLRKLAEKLNMKEQAAHYHLTVLKNAGLIEVSKKEEVRGAVAKYYSTKFNSISLVFNKNGIKLSPPQVLNIRREVMIFLEPFITNGRFDAKIIVGSPDAHGPYRAQARDAHYAIELAAFIGSISSSISDEIVKLDTEVRDEDLKSNMIVIGGPVTNMVSYKINDTLPIRFELKEQNRIFSSITSRTYYEDSCGIIVKAVNPFNVNSKILVLAGKRFQGTKAAVLAVTKYLNKVAENNSFNPSIPARVVMGYDLNGDGIIDDVEFLE
ncbi:MAG: S-layer protein [Candidatus Jordarchaeales archaeon]